MVRCLALLVLVTGCSSARPIRGGPLAQPGVRTGESVPMDAGKTGTYGMETLANHGHTEVILDRIDFLHRSPGLEIIGPLVMHLRTKPGVPALATGLIRQYPPPHEGATLHPVAGFRISPHRSLEGRRGALDRLPGTPCGTAFVSRVRDSLPRR